MAHAQVLPDASVIGKLVDPKTTSALQARVTELMGAPFAGFPGAQPVSLERRHLPDLSRKPYFACEKTDGTRYLLLVERGCAFMIDRSYKFYFVPLAFPTRMVDPATKKPTAHHNTVLDGELIVDEIGGKQELCFLIFDLMAVNGQQVTRLPLPKRLQLVRDMVLGPRAQWAASKVFDMSKEPCRVTLKPMYHTPHVGFVLREVIPKLPHANDGIIFTPVMTPYVVGTDQALLKWKPNELNSVDFAIKVHFRGGAPYFALLASDRLVKQHYDWITLPRELVQRHPGTAANQLNFKIAECVYDPEYMTFIPGPDLSSWAGGEWRKGGWKWMRFREDKANPNDVSVIERILKSAADNVTQDDLMQVLCPHDLRTSSAADASASDVSRAATTASAAAASATASDVAAAATDAAAGSEDAAGAKRKRPHE